MEQIKLKKGFIKVFKGTPKEIEIRNNQILNHFREALLKNPRLTPSGFSKKHAAKHGLKPRRVRDILKMAVGNQPG